MRDTARLAAMDLPDANPHFRRGWSWDIPDRLPHQRPRRRPARSLDHLVLEIASDHRRVARAKG